jgi:hypothetical protein
MSDGWEFVLLLGGIVLGVILVVLVIVVGPAKWINEAACNQKGSRLNLPADYRLLSNTCYVQVPGGRWVDVGSYRVFQRGER